jgi:hypothetical protein
MRMFLRCPKCGHHPLPPDQALPAACPACGVILAKVAQARTAGAAPAGRVSTTTFDDDDDGSGDGSALARLAELIVHVPERVDITRFWLRVALFVVFLVWGLWLIAIDHRSGEMGSSFLHGPLLVFHEAGHVLMRPFGEWLMFFGGTLGQLLMPMVLCGALLLKNRDPFGAAIGLWFFGVSLLDVAPYVYDALEPQLVLLSGATGEAGGHDWIYLLSSIGLLQHAQRLGGLTRVLGGATVLLALGWAAWVLMLQRERVAGDVTEE